MSRHRAPPTEDPRSSASHRVRRICDPANDSRRPLPLRLAPHPRPITASPSQAIRVVIATSKRCLSDPPPLTGAVFASLCPQAGGHLIPFASNPRICSAAALLAAHVKGPATCGRRSHTPVKQSMANLVRSLGHSHATCIRIHHAA